MISTTSSMEKEQTSDVFNFEKIVKEVFEEPGGEAVEVCCKGENGEHETAENVCSSSGSSESESDEEIEKILETDYKKGEEELKDLMDEECSEGEEDVDKINVSGVDVGPKTVHELSFEESSKDLLELPLPSINSNHTIKEACTIMSSNIWPGVDVVVARASSSSAQTVLDHGSLLCTSSRKLVGRIDDVFGPVSAPFYSIKILGDFASTKKASPSSNSNPKVKAADSTPVSREAQEKCADHSSLKASSNSSLVDDTIAKDSSLKNSPENSEPNLLGDDNDGSVEKRSHVICETETTFCNNQDSEEESGDNTSMKKMDAAISPTDEIQATTNLATEKCVKEGQLLYWIPEFSTVVETSKLDQKGTDASNSFNEEVDVNEMEFSDDEEERNFKMKHRKQGVRVAKRRGGTKQQGKNSGGTQRSQQPQQQRYPQNSNLHVMHLNPGIQQPPYGSYQQQNLSYHWQQQQHQPNQTNTFNPNISTHSFNQQQLVKSHDPRQQNPIQHLFQVRRSSGQFHPNPVQQQPFHHPSTTYNSNAFNTIPHPHHQSQATLSQQIYQQHNQYIPQNPRPFFVPSSPRPQNSHGMPFHLNQQMQQSLRMQQQQQKQEKDMFI